MRRQARRGILAPMGPRGITAAALVALGVLAAPAAAADRAFEGEGMTSSGAAAVVDDDGASGGQALELVAGASARREVITAAPSYWISVRARGTDCLGPAGLTVRVDGAERFAGPAPTGGYSVVEARLPSLARGTHVVEVEATGGGLAPGCRRSVRVDRVTVHSPFSDGSFRNRRLSDAARLHPDSPRLARSLKSQALVTPGTVWVSTNNWSVPVYVVPAGQPRARVDSPSWEVEQQLDGAPVPPDAKPARPADGDAELVVYQPATDRIWEFHHMRKVTGGWRAEWGGRMDHVSANPGYFTNARGGLTFGASASRLSLFGGLQTIDELKAGAIDHAVDLILPNVTQGSFVWPAQASDQRGRAIGPDPIPEGTRFRLPPSLDVDSLGLPPYTRALALAIQRYGAVVRDRGGVVSFKAEDPTPTGEDPYADIFDGMWPNEKELLAKFPWDRMQALAVPRPKAEQATTSGRFTTTRR